MSNKMSQIRQDVVDSDQVLMEFVVATCNIRYAADDAGNGWPMRLPLLSETIRKAAPMVLGTQEGWEWQLRELESALGEYRIVDENRYWMEERMYPCLFVAAGVETARSGDVWLSQTPDRPGSRSFGSIYPRLMCWAEIELDQKRPVLFANLHLDHLSAETRSRQIEVALTALSEIATPEEPICLMGDFNDPPDGEVARTIIRHSGKLGLHFYDPWKQLDLPEVSSYHGFGTAEESWSRIDWILLSDHFGCAGIDLVRDAEPPLYPSDHYPVVARVFLDQ